MTVKADNPKLDLSQPPAPMPVQVQNIPQSLKVRPNWVNWRWIPKGKKWQKPPINGTSTDPKSWRTFDAALATIPADGGIGFAMGVDGCGLVGIDLDNCRDPVTGAIDAEAQLLIDLFATYTEVSPSGTGVKMWLVLNGESFDKFRSKVIVNDIDVEVYVEGRYFTVTGHIVGSKRELVVAGPSFWEFANKHLRRSELPTNSKEFSDADPSRIAELAKEAIAYCDPNCDYSTWISIGMAIKSVGDSLFPVWDEWSQSGDNYPGSTTCAQHWDSFPGKSGKVTVGTLFHFAKEGGYDMPPLEKIRAAKIDPRDEAKHIARYLSIDGVTTLRLHRDEALEWSADRGCYRPLLKSELRGVITNAADRRLTHVLPAHVSALADQYAALHTIPSDVELPHWLDDTPWRATECFACRDAVIHLPSFVDAKPHYSLSASPAFVSTNATDYAFNPKAAKPQRWLNFLDEIFKGDGEQVELLQRWFGYCLVPDTSKQKMLCMIGPPRSGKGETARTLTNLLGEKNLVGPTLSSLSGEFGLQPMQHKLVAIIADARLGSRVDANVTVERLLSITGEDSLSINRKQLSHVTARLPVRLMLLSNELPELRDSSGALANRMLIIETRTSFLGRESVGLGRELMQERSGVLLWAIEGWRKLREVGRFTESTSTRERANQLVELSSPIKAFVADQCELSGEVPKKLLYANYRVWCERDGHWPVSASVFGRDLSSAFPDVSSARPGTADREYVYRGIRLRRIEAMDSGQSIDFGG